MGNTGPRFEPCDGDTDSRVRTLEFWAAEHAEYSRGRQTSQEAAMAAVNKRLQALEGGWVKLQLAIGGVRIKIGFVVAAAGAVGGAVVAIAAALIGK